MRARTVCSMRPKFTVGTLRGDSSAAHPGLADASPAGTSAESPLRRNGDAGDLRTARMRRSRLLRGDACADGDGPADIDNAVQPVAAPSSKPSASAPAGAAPGAETRTGGSDGIGATLARVAAEAAAEASVYTVWLVLRSLSA